MTLKNNHTRPVWFRAMADYLGLVAGLGLLILTFSLSTRYFFSATNLQTIVNQIPAAIIIATGVTFVLIIGGVDLSVGSVMGFSRAVMGVCMVQLKWSIWSSCAAALGAGALCGVFNGFVTVRWALPSFIVTLGMLEMARGATHLVTNSQTQYIGSAVDVIASTSIFGVSLPFILAILIVAAAQFTLTRTVFGRYMIAIGTNEEAVRLSGIDPRPVKTLVFVISGFLVAIAAIIDTARFQSANPNAGAFFELQAIAAAVIGGTSLMGGRGSIIRTFFGVLIIAVLDSGLAAMGVKDEKKRIITGAVIVGAVILDQYRQRRKLRNR